MIIIMRVLIIRIKLNIGYNNSSIILLVWKIRFRLNIPIIMKVTVLLLIMKMTALLLILQVIVVLLPMLMITMIFYVSNVQSD